MKKKISPKITALTFGVLIIAFLAVFYAVAWQEPAQAPPGGNVPTPLNVGPTGQSKAGGLILNTGGAEKGLIIDKGQVCIGTDCRSGWPTAVAIPSGMIAMFDTACPAGWTRFAALDGRFPLGAATYGGTGGSATHSHQVTILGERIRVFTPPPSEGTYYDPCNCSATNVDVGKDGTYPTNSASNLPPYLNVIWCKKN